MRKLIIIAILTILVMPACKKAVDREVEKKSGEVPVAEILDMGRAYLANGKYYTARKYFQLIIDNAPNSGQFPAAKLGLADAYYFDLATGSADALPEYQSYLVYFPNNPEAAYAQYMVGMCYYAQVESPDRDQSYTRKALAEFEKLHSQYPDSPYNELSEEQIQLCWHRLAQHEFGVAIFYYKAGTYKAAEGRFRSVLDQYLSYLTSEERELTYYYFSQTLFSMTQYDEAARYIRKLLAEFPQTIHRDTVRSQLEDIESGKLQQEKEERLKEMFEKIKEKKEADDGDTGDATGGS